VSTTGIIIAAAMMQQPTMTAIVIHTRLDVDALLIHTVYINE
jgi:hypothetical protein